MGVLIGDVFILGWCLVDGSSRQVSIILVSVSVVMVYSGVKSLKLMSVVVVVGLRIMLMLKVVLMIVMVEDFFVVVEELVMSVIDVG